MTAKRFPGDGGHYFLFAKFFKIFPEVGKAMALGSYMTFSPIFQNVPGNGWQWSSIRYLCVIFAESLEILQGRPLGSCVIFQTIFSKFLFYWEGEGSISIRPFSETFQNFSPTFLRGQVAKYVSCGWWRLWKMETDLWGRHYLVGHAPYPHLTYMKVGTKLLSKNIIKNMFLFFASSRRLRYSYWLMVLIFTVCFWKTH